MVTLGIDRIASLDALFAGKRIGLITNYSGVDSTLTTDIRVFNHCGFQVKRLFTPEHGLYGAMDGKAVENSEEPVFHLPIVSLYESKTEPDEEDLADIDLLVYDIQDVGLRYYTYIYTLAGCMKAAAKYQRPLVVLDRPDPLGSTVGGARIEETIHSFVGDYQLPVRYGLTAGELGYYFKDYLKLDLEYMVVPMQHYKRSMKWPQTGQLWNLPSPSIHTFQTLLCYNGGCFFEATNVSEGRGTAEPFQIFGAPFIRMDELSALLKERIHSADVAIRERAFTPFWSKYAGKTCYGVEFIPLTQELDFLPAALITMRTIAELYPEEFELKSYADVSRLEQLTGSRRVEDYLFGKADLAELLESWEQEDARFIEQTRKFQIYEE